MSESYVSLRPQKVGLLSQIKHPHITLAYFPNASPDELRDALPETIEWGGTVIQFTGAGIWRGQMGNRPEYWTSYHSVESDRPSHPLHQLRNRILEDAQAYGHHADQSFPFIPHITQRVTSTYQSALDQLDVALKPNKFGVDRLYISRPNDYQNAYEIPLT